ncbi:enolase C-terminal domain-like protein [Paraburkholderia rhizosphaerae]|uniref:L-alanine-DL-glutamate epimerase-like enolase superfamily enzyme n=1 Tax=Paraburkholderia rhizosphaerae TaxID=480658 RepID=A0A4R8L9H5_9BURK|nr:enolase C-terminal domain-like protein [Paraburkholderia rhizosphaerae]TDY39045.1 L-alanine-DL-glutamate epimerase-like enolase superfamily enzyme [Paraburkholderia rhizosphaerae]
MHDTASSCAHDRFAAAPITRVVADAYTIPTDAPEADGTLEWNSTTLVVAEIEAAGATGIGYTYNDACVVTLIRQTLAPVLLGEDASDVQRLWLRMQRRVRNIGRDGVAATAISALDCALWDLHAKRQQLALVKLLGQARDRVPVYGSGGFTTYTDEQMRDQLTHWVRDDGCRWVKIKIGSDPARDPARAQCARDAIGPDAGLFVDANGAFDRQTALRFAADVATQDVQWFEEPVSSDDLAGLAAIRRAAPPGMQIAAGEYGYTADYFRRMLEAGAVDVLQADASRCGGVTGFMQAAALAHAFHVPLSAHCAPALHLHVTAAVAGLRHQEWFHDHARIESMLFDGAPRVADGCIAPDLSRPGLGLELKRQDAQRYAA